MPTNKSHDTVTEAKDAAADAMEQITDNLRTFIEERPISVALGCLFVGYLWGKIHG
jgi:hypothetical protein